MNEAIEALEQADLIVLDQVHYIQVLYQIYVSKVFQKHYYVHLLQNFMYLML